MFRKAVTLLLVLALLALVPAAYADIDEEGTIYSRTGGEMGILRVGREEETPMGDTPWTILIYMCGSDLESKNGYAVKDLKEIIGSTFSENVQVVVQIGGASSWHAKSIHPDAIERYVKSGNKLTLAERLPGADMGDPGTLADFISWGVENYGAEKMGLILWDHGGGSISGVCFDETRDRNSLSLRDLDSALFAAFSDMTDRFEFIGFDACLMATVETAGILVPYARCMYASQETEPGTGWSYTSLLNYLAKHPETDGRTLGEVQCEIYQAAHSGIDTVTFSAVDLDRLDELLLAFDRTAKELYESDSLSLTARAALSADNFGGNTRTAGYTNMIDLADFLRHVSSIAPSAQETLDLLDEAVYASANGDRHSLAGGLSVYYPLNVGGSSELVTYRDICTSTYYLALVDKLAYGTTGGDMDKYDNSYLFADTGNVLSISYAPDEDVGTTTEGGSTGSELCPLPVENVYLDENGSYTVLLSDTELLAYGSCSLMMDYQVGGQEYIIYLGEDDNLNIDFDTGVVLDNFDGSWVWLDGYLLPIELVYQDDEISMYICEVVLNGEKNNLCIAYYWDGGGFEVLGTWSGIDSESGMAGRIEQGLQDGDVIQFVYYFYYDNWTEYDQVFSDPYTVDGELNLYYDTLSEGLYYYAINLYDIYGGYWQTDSVAFGVDEDGSPYIPG